MKPFRNISVKLLVTIAAAACLCIAGLTYLLISRTTEDLESEVERHANQLSETVKYGTREDMLHNQRERIHRLIRNMAEQPGIHRIRVLNKIGEVAYSSHETDIGTMVDKKAEACYACHAADQPLERLPVQDRTRLFRLHPDSSRILGIINPIYNEPSCWTADCHEHDRDQTVLGVLDVTMSLREIDDRTRQSAMDTLLFGLVTVAVMGALVFVTTRHLVARPVRKLVEATREVGSGNLQYKIPVLRDDELGALAQSFNQMTVKLGEARLQLFQSDKMASLGRLAAGVAHEINNPLTGVLTYSSFLLKQTRDRPDLQEDLKVIVRETLRSREIVKSLLDFARQSVPKRKDSDLNEIIRHAVRVVENQLKTRKVRVEVHADPALPPLRIDDNQIQQVILNLLVNAADAMEERGGAITIRTSRLKLAAYGSMHLKKAECPKRHSLMDHEHKIEGHPSVRLKIRDHQTEGQLYLDPVYGHSAHQYSLITDHRPIEVFCPQCGISLIEKEKTCPVCSAPIFAIDIPSQGRIENCSRPDCGWQRWPAADQRGDVEYAEIRIRDEGCGIAADNLNRIFEPFFSTKGQRGTGLGLSVVWGIIDNHNGSIRVESTLHHGTTFIIQLPIGWIE